MINQEYLKSILSYDSTTGIFRWKMRPYLNKTWNTRYAGTIAGTPRTHGHMYININGGNFYASHSLAWLYVHGVWPKEIDHKDGNPKNNKINNLRSVTSSQNMMNRGKPINNTSGYKGVSYRKDRKKWRASIKKDGKFFALGHYNTPELAYAAYCAAAKQLHGEYARIA